MKPTIITLLFITALLFSSTGFAGNNTVNLVQSGNDNTALIIQEELVNEGFASVIQDGDHNDVVIHQISWGDVSATVAQQNSSQSQAMIIQDDSGSYVDLTQINSTNVTAIIQQDQGPETGYKPILLHQEGSDLLFQATMSGHNRIFARDDGRGQFGANNSAHLIQGGNDSNTIYFRQDGEFNNAVLTQTSLFSEIWFDQNGEQNSTFFEIDSPAYADIQQAGTSNQIDLFLTGDGGILINQFGTANVLMGTAQVQMMSPDDFKILQGGNQNMMMLDINNWDGQIHLTQTGDSGIMSLMQNDGSGLTAELTQSGVNNVMTVSQTGTGNHVIVTQQ